MIKTILQADNPELRKKSKPVAALDKKVQGVIKDLKDTLKVQNDPEGVGLAAPQIGKKMRIFLMKNGRDVKTVINPEIKNIEKMSGKKKGDKTPAKKIMEGCLSLPHYYGPLTRAKKLTLKYQTEEGIEKEEVFEGFDAQIILHEIDHLNGILFIDRLLEQKKPLYEYLNGEWERVELI